MQPHLVDLLPGGEFIPITVCGTVRPTLLRACAALEGLCASRAAGTAGAYVVSTNY